MKSEVTVNKKMVVYSDGMELPVTTTTVTTDVLTIEPIGAPAEG